MAPVTAGGDPQAASPDTEVLPRSAEARQGSCSCLMRSRDALPNAEPQTSTPPAARGPEAVPCRGRAAWPSTCPFDISREAGKSCFCGTS